MKIGNKLTGDVLDFPPPDSTGRTALFLNGKRIAGVRFEDNPTTIILDDGRRFSTDGFNEYIVEVLRIKTAKVN